MTHRIAKPSREARAIALAAERRPASDRVADTLIALFLAAAVLAAAGAAHGQSLWGVRLGQPVEDFLLQYNDAEILFAELEYWLMNYSLEFDTGTILTVTGAGVGQQTICSIDVQWGGSERDAALAAPGIRFGKTTRADLNDHLGSRGFFYDGAPEAYLEDGIAGTYGYYDFAGYESLLVVKLGSPIDARDREPDTLGDVQLGPTLRGLSVTHRGYVEWMYGDARSSRWPCPVVARWDW